MGRVRRLALPIVCLASLVAAPAVAQEPGTVGEIAVERGVGKIETSRLRLPWAEATWPTFADTLGPVDVEARFEEFQRAFERDFGRGGGDDAERRLVDLGERVKKRLAARFQGGAMFRWYRRAVGFYDRVEGFYERIESATNWATAGFDVDAQVESVVDGRVAVHVEREILGFDVGLGVRDATAGRVGLQVGGELRGYKINLDVTDLAAGQLRFGLRKRLD